MKYKNKLSVILQGNHIGLYIYELHILKMTDSRFSEDIQGFLDKVTTKEFLACAKQFTDLLETPDIPNEVFYKAAHSALVKLYAAGHALEEINLKYSVDADFDRNEFFQSKDRNQISELGKDSFYSEVFDPVNEDDKEPSQGWLVDDFSDIYRDLKIELTKIETIGTEKAVEDALWQMKWSYLNHWGQHAISALRALHFLFYEGKHVM
ncbi:MAG: DUF5063 domain-containing protein [Pedobacter agri]